MVLLSPVPELRDSSKLNDSLYNEDCTFQQLGTYIHSVRDPVHNRVTLVSLPSKGEVAGQGSSCVKRNMNIFL